jgi:hypothetical protein
LFALEWLMKILATEPTPRPQRSSGDPCGDHRVTLAVPGGSVLEGS